MEEPCSSENLDALAEIRSRTCIPVVTGEAIYTKERFREVLEKRSADILNPDVCSVGGILPLLESGVCLDAFFGKGRMRPLLEAMPVKSLLVEFPVQAAAAEGMYGSGMFIINPPWTLEKKLHETLPKLTQLLAQDDSALFTLESQSA